MKALESKQRVPVIAVLGGGKSREARVSVESAEALEKNLREGGWATRLYLLEQDGLPEALRPQQHIVFPALHGGFGEDGRLQKACEEKGLVYAGSGGGACKICLSKSLTKDLARRVGVRVAPGFLWRQGDRPLESAEVVESLGTKLIIKPENEGSSLDVQCLETVEAIEGALGKLRERGGAWLVESYLMGEEVNVGWLNGTLLPPVSPQVEGVFTYEKKYEASVVKSRWSSTFEVEKRLRDSAEKTFNVCGCRDFARADFIIQQKLPYLLEVNALPGLAEGSSFRRGMQIAGISEECFGETLLLGALKRFRAAHGERES